MGQHAALGRHHPAPGTPTEPDGKGGVRALPQSPLAIGQREKHTTERIALEAAVMLGVTGPDGPFTTALSEDQQAAWVRAALVWASECATMDLCNAVHAGASRIREGAGDTAKKPSASTDQPPS
jgi:hypothetical protein